MDRKEILDLKKKLIDLKDFQEFVIENKVVSSVDLEKRFYSVYRWLLDKNFSRDIIYFGKTDPLYKKDEKILDSLENFNSRKDFQDYIDKHNIESISHLKIYNFYVYRRLLSLGIKDQLTFKNENFPEVYWLFKKYNTIEDFQNLININKIRSRKEFIEKLGNSLYNLFCGLGFNDLVVYFGKTKPKISIMPTPLEIKTLQDYIIENKIISSQELRKKIGRKYFDEKISGTGILSYIHYFGKSPKYIRINPEDFDTLEKIQKYINENKIESMGDLNLKIRVLIQIKNFTKHLKFFSKKDCPELCNEEDFNTFIKNNKITGSLDFNLRFPTLYRTAIALGVNINYFEREISIKDRYKTPEFFQELIDSENIVNPSDFRARFPLIYQYLSDNKFCGLMKYKEGINCSNLEREVETLLNTNNIEFIARQQHQFLSNHKSLDVLITKYNIGIECQGDFHFIPVDFYGGDEQFKRVRERDLEKYNECKSKGIILLYYVNPVYMRWGYRNKILSSIPNYIDKVYSNLDDLWKRIQEIIKEKDKCKI